MNGGDNMRVGDPLLLLWPFVKPTVFACDGMVLRGKIAFWQAELVNKKDGEPTTFESSWYLFFSQ